MFPVAAIYCNPVQSKFAARKDTTPSCSQLSSFWWVYVYGMKHTLSDVSRCLFQFKSLDLRALQRSECNLKKQLMRKIRLKSAS
jgi:hypothetical protein